ncbi:MAG: lytic murein transglycosylase [Parcubacteria group bacterium]|nr:lytic murein transglycosylase [Parcubacteria group bacterium]
MSTKKFLILFSLLLTFYFSLFTFFVSGQSDVQQEISEREKQIQELERQKEEYQKQIAEKQGEARTLQNEVFILDTQIRQLQVEIRAFDLAIQRTSEELEDTVQKIDEALKKIERIKKSLAEFIRLIHQSDQENLFAILLKNKDISDFFTNVESIRSSQEKAQVTIQELKELRTGLEEKQEKLEQTEKEYIGLKNIQEFEKKQIDVKKAEKDEILRITKGQEKKFQELVKETDKNIQILKEQIQFLLAQGITLEEAIKFGHLAAISAGIRPAFLLAILETESKLGANVGKCYITDTLSGASRSVASGQVFSRGIHPTRDLPIFLKITGALGKDPLATPISCWIPVYSRSGAPIGWGGAMGPAQFIPSTWVLVDDQVSAITGRNPADPWNIEDAFLASALLLAQGGATGKTIAAEEAAAMAYFSGDSRCNTNRNKSLSLRIQCASYANLVIANAVKIEAQLPAN